MGATILVVDDDSAIRRLLRLLLEDEGMTAVEAANGAEALAHLSRTPASFHLIILDMSMPEMDGRTFVEETRRRGYDLPPILVLTAYGARQAQREIEAAAARESRSTWTPCCERSATCSKLAKACPTPRQDRHISGEAIFRTGGASRPESPRDSHPSTGYGSRQEGADRRAGPDAPRRGCDVDHRARRLHLADGAVLEVSAVPARGGNRGHQAASCLRPRVSV